MGRTTTVMGILVLIIGIIGIMSWIYVYSQASGALSTLSSIEQGARTVESITGAVSWIPFVGDIASGVGGAAGFTASTAGSIRMTITLYIVSNIFVNAAFVFIGIALIDTGMGHGKIKNVLRDTRDYLREERDRLTRKRRK